MEAVKMSAYSIAIDIGGTFTDAVLRNKEDGRFWVDKTLTTPDDLRQGFFTAVEAVLKRADCRPNLVDEAVVHATTIVTNAIIERKGPKTALIVTEGFPDVLVIRDECRSDIFDNQLELPKPLIPAELTFGLPERTLSNGSVFKKVMKKAGISSVAVCLLNAYKNPDNERQVRDILTEELPHLFISLSGEVSPQMREYPRASTTAINAYTVPIVQPYLIGLRADLQKAGFQQGLLIMLSSGGVIGAEIAG